jgi:hypothetical protein
MAPEQARGESVDHRADLFSLGSVLYALCTGRPPFRAITALAVLKRVCEEEPRAIREINPEIPEWLADIIAKLHAKNVRQRFQSASEVSGLLGQHLSHLQQPTKTPMPPSVERPMAQPARGRSWLHRNRLAVGLAALLLLSLWIGPSLYRLSTTGTLAIDVDDRSVQVFIYQDSELIHSLRSWEKPEINLPPGTYQILVTAGPNREVTGVRLDGRRFFDKWSITSDGGSCPLVLKIGDRAVLTASLVETPVHGPRVVREFAPAIDKPLARDSVTADQDGWRIETGGETTLPFFELTGLDLHDGNIVYRGEMKAGDLEGAAYLFLQCYQDGNMLTAKNISPGLEAPSDWARFEVSFQPREGQHVDRIKLSVVVTGKGTVWIKDIRVMH